MSSKFILSKLHRGYSLQQICDTWNLLAPYYLDNEIIEVCSSAVKALEAQGLIKICGCEATLI